MVLIIGRNDEALKCSGPPNTPGERESISFVARRSWQCLGLIEVMLLGAFVR